MINSNKFRGKWVRGHLNTKTPRSDWGLQAAFSIFSFIFIRFSVSVFFFLPHSTFHPFHLASLIYLPATIILYHSLPVGCQPFSASNIFPSISFLYIFIIFYFDMFSISFHFCIHLIFNFKFPACQQANRHKFVYVGSTITCSSLSVLIKGVSLGF